jgi:hypothetical protein
VEHGCLLLDGSWHGNLPHKILRCNSIGCLRFLVNWGGKARHLSTSKE